MNAFLMLQELRHAVLARSRHMSLGLALSVAVLTLGIGAMMLATIRRYFHFLALPFYFYFYFLACSLYFYLHFLYRPSYF